MAITVLNQPPTYYPIFHENVFRLDSTNKNQTNFKYVFRIGVTNPAGIPERKIKVSPEPANGYGYFDARRHLLDFILQDIFDITDANFQTAPRVEYIMRIDEEYVDGGGNKVINVDEEVFLAKTAYNSHFDRNEFFGGLGGINIDNVPGKLLTNIPDDALLFQDDRFYFHFIGQTFDPAKTPLKFVIEELDTSGNILATTTIAGGGGGTGSDFVTADLSQIVFNAGTYFINVFLAGADNVKMTTPKRFRVAERPCSTRKQYKLVYLDPKGSYVSINFDGASNKTNNFKNKTFRKFIDPVTQSETSRGVQRYFTDETEELNLNTLITDEQGSEMFLNLLRSNRVFIDLTNDPDFDNVDFFPVEVLTNSVTEKKAENEQLPQYAVKIRFAFEQISR